MKISICGYMCSGKSTVGSMLATKINYTFIDLDSEIEKKEKASINQIFTKKGEIYFRKLEHNVLSQILEKKGNFVIALGGGTPVYFDNMHRIIAKSFTVYLSVSIAVLAERIIKEPKVRPIVAHLKKENSKEFVAKHLLERNGYYNKSQYTVHTKEKNAKEISQQIIKELTLRNLL